MAKTITLPYPPSVNHYWRMVNGRMLISRDGRAYKQRAALMALSAGCQPVSGPVTVMVDVYRPARRGDLDNCCKALFDSLKGIAWDDDSQIVEIHARRFEDKVNPRAVVTISPHA